MQLVWITTILLSLDRFWGRKSSPIAPFASDRNQPKQNKHTRQTPCRTSSRSCVFIFVWLVVHLLPFHILWLQSILQEVITSTLKRESWGISWHGIWYFYHITASRNTIFGLVFQYSAVPARPACLFQLWQPYVAPHPMNMWYAATAYCANLHNFHTICWGNLKNHLKCLSCTWPLALSFWEEA